MIIPTGIKLGLAQSFKFKYNDILEIEDLLNEFECSKKNKLWIINDFNSKQMEFEIAIEDYGLYTHRNGDYFEVLGLLVEQLTAKFGQIEIGDF